MARHLESVMEELITRGIHRAEPTTAITWTKPYWFVRDRPQKADPRGPQQVLWLIHPQDNFDPAVIQIRTCSCCTQVVTVDYMGVSDPEDPTELDLIASVAMWNGLDKTLAWHRQFHGLYLAQICAEEE